MSRSKTEYMQASGVDDGGKLRLQGEMVKNWRSSSILGQW